MLNLFICNQTLIPFVQSPSKDPKQGTGYPPLFGDESEATPHTPFPKYSPVWVQYLDDAASRARANADTWQTAIDAHLLFVGLILPATEYTFILTYLRRPVCSLELSHRSLSTRETTLWTIPKGSY